MLNSFDTNRNMYDSLPWPQADAAPFQWLPTGIAFIRRRFRPIAIATLAGMFCALVYLLVTPSQYTAVTTLNINATPDNPVDGQAVQTDWQSQSAYIDSQVALMESPATLRGVVTQLDLGHNRRFAGGLAKAPGPASEAAQVKAELVLSHMVQVWREGATSVVDVRVHSTDPVLSANLANAVAQAYTAQQLDAISGTTAQAGNWLQSRLGQLRAQALAADQAVQAYKAKNNIIEVTSGTGTGLLDEQQLGALNSELASAGARVATAQATYEQAKADAASGQDNFMESSASPNPVLAGLQQQYLNALSLQAELTARLGPAHGAVLLQNKVVAALQQNIVSEMQGQVASDRADYQAALADQASLQAQLTREAEAEAQTNLQMSQLHALQSSADADREIYQNFLQRFTQAIQDQSYPVASAWVAAPALPPLNRSYPSGKITLAVGLLLGLALGLMFALIKEALDRSVRTVSQLRSATGLDFLGAIPESTALLAQQRPAWLRIGPAGSANANRMNVPPAFLTAASNPGSRIADAVQSVRVAAARHSARGRDIRIIGCVSATSDEGCSTFAANLAFALAADGERTMLLDWNTGSPWLTKMLSAGPQSGMQEYLAGLAPLAAVAQTEPQTRLGFIGQSLGRVAGVLAGPAKIQAMLAELRGAYDVVVIDLPAMRDSNMAIQLSEWIDGLVLITRWGTTPQAVLVDALTRRSTADPVFLGVVLNFCDPERMRLYNGDAAPQPRRRVLLPVEAEMQRITAE